MAHNCKKPRLWPLAKWKANEIWICDRCGQVWQLFPLKRGLTWLRVDLKD